MSVPTAPYTTTARVAIMVPALVDGASDFSSATYPNKFMVEQVIGWVSAQINMQFRSAGYKVPFIALAGEEWPSEQTTYLELIATLGSAAYVSSHVLRPAPAVAPGREGSGGNIYQQLYDRQLEMIYNPITRKSLLAFRAEFYPGTAAEEALTVPLAPLSDFMEKQFDPLRYMGVYTMTDVLREIYTFMQQRQIPWDYMYNYQGFNAGLGGIP